MKAQQNKSDLSAALAARFSDGGDLDVEVAGDSAGRLMSLACRGSVRQFSDRPVSSDQLRLLSALALAAPTKSDLQQRDIVMVTEPALRGSINLLIDDQSWVAEAPAMLVFCGNNRRQRQIHEMQGHPFANDHLDAFFNAAVDAGIALTAFVMAAETLGLGCCPVSALRNESEKVSHLLGLPDHVFPVAGLAVGWPAQRAPISPRLPLGVTFHENRFSEDGIEEAIAAYDPSRHYESQRFVEEYGKDASYGWSEDKTRQYSKPERADFGAFIRSKGFCLD